MRSVMAAHHSIIPRRHIGPPGLPLWGRVTCTRGAWCGATSERPKNEHGDTSLADLAEAILGQQLQQALLDHDAPTVRVLADEDAAVARLA